MSTPESRYYDARDDRIADDQEAREAARLRADRRGLEQGDHVTVGKDTRTVYTIQGFGIRANGTHYADLYRAGALCDTTVNVDRLRPADATCPTCGGRANPGPPVWCLRCDEPAVG